MHNGPLLPGLESTAELGVVSLPENAFLYRNWNRNARLIILGVAAFFAAVLAYEVLVVIIQLRAGAAGSDESVRLALGIAPPLAILLILLWAARLFGPGPVEMRLDSRGLAFRYPTGRELVYRWNAPGFRLEIDIVDPRPRWLGPTDGPDIQITGYMRPRIALNPEALRLLLDAAQSQGIPVERIDHPAPAGWSRWSELIVGRGAKVGRQW